MEQLEPRQLLNAIPQGPEFRVNSTTLRDQFAPAVARDMSGNFVVVWASVEADPTNINVYAQRYNAAGTPQGGQFLVNQFTTGVQSRPRVAMDADGDFVVVWQSGTADSNVFPGQDGSGSGVYARRYNSVGTPQGNEFRVNSYTTNDQNAPSVATDNNGNFVVAWNSFGQDGSGWGVYAQRYSAAGAVQGGEFRVNSFTTNTQIDPSVAFAGDGSRFVIAWTSGTLASPGGQDGSYYGIYAQRYNSAGTPQGGEFRVNTFTPDFQTDPSVAMDHDGDFVVTWNSWGQDGSEYGIYAQRYNASGVAQGGEFRVNTFTPFSQSDPRVSMTPGGAFVVVWSSNLQDGSGRGVYGQEYTATGAALGTEFRVNTFTPNHQTRPDVAMDNGGNFVVVFQDGSNVPNVNGQDGSGYGIYARRYLSSVDTTPPTVTNAVFNFLTNQSVSVTFSENVSASLSTSDVQLQNLTTGQFIPTGQMSLSYNLATNTATLTFPGVGILPDGNYRVRLIAAGISDAAGNQLDGNGDGMPGGDYLFDFYVLAGDANRDRRVNLGDFNILAANFGQSPRNFAQGDFNYDGIVNLSDFNILAARFGTILDPPTTLTGTAASFGIGGRLSGPSPFADSTSGENERDGDEILV